jgi:hypothetical protein
MHVFGAFELDLQPGTPENPASVKVALLRHIRGRGRPLVYIMPDHEGVHLIPLLLLH